MYSPEHWPLDKIERNLARPSRGRRCVLLTTGALKVPFVATTSLAVKPVGASLKV